MMLDLLLFHAYRIADDPHEQEIMRPFPPLGIQSLVAWLRAQGVQKTDWFDTTFADSIERFHDHVHQTDPRVVGLYGHTITRPIGLRMAARCQAEGRRVIAGGPDPGSYPHEYLSGGVEVIVHGEGELTLLELMTHLSTNRWQWDWDTLGNVHGISFVAPDGTLVTTPPRKLIKPLDQLPWPHRDRRDLDAYMAAWRERHGETALSLTTSRGCPYHCTWCSKAVYGDTFRRRSVEDVVSEVLHLRERFDPDQLWFVDDMFTLNRKWVTRFTQEMQRRHAVMPYYLIGRPEMIDDEMATALKRSGCYRVYMSAESGSQKVLDAMRKGNTTDHVRRAAKALKNAGIELGVFVMLGYPGEELDDIRLTIDFIKDLEPDVTLLSVAHPIKGTQFYQQVASLVTGVGDGGRLTFQMRYPREFYEVAQRHFWTETKLARKWRHGQVDREFVALAAKYPMYRAAFEWWGR